MRDRFWKSKLLKMRNQNETLKQNIFLFNQGHNTKIKENTTRIKLSECYN